MSKSAIRNPKSKIPRIVLYSQEHVNCTCYENIFNHQFETVITGSEDEFLERIRSSAADAAVVCFCTAQEKNAQEFLRLESLAGPLPMLSCSEILHADFIKWAAQRGFDGFLSCRMEIDKIRELIYEAISRGGLKGFFEACWPGAMDASPHIGKVMDEIIHSFPRRLHEKEIAEKLGISQSWLQKLCRKAFGESFPRLMRRIWVHQALRMMMHTNLDSTEIATQLNYSEESNMARDFRKELGYRPGKARQLLTHYSPEKLLLK